VKLLLEFGANLGVKNCVGFSPLGNSINFPRLRQFLPPTSRSRFTIKGEKPSAAENSRSVRDANYEPTKDAQDATLPGTVAENARNRTGLITRSLARLGKRST
jgi:hypothetical protein